MVPSKVAGILLLPSPIRFAYNINQFRLIFFKSTQIPYIPGCDALS